MNAPQGRVYCRTSAVDDSDPQGTLDDDELRVLHERVARAHRLRLDVLALAQARRLIDQLRTGGGS